MRGVRIGVLASGSGTNLEAILDAGPVLAQESVPVVAGDDEETLHERIKAVERKLYPATIKAIIERGSVQ